MNRSRIFLGLCGLAFLCCAPNAQAGPKLNFPAKHIVFDIGGVLVSLHDADFKSRMLPIAGALDAPEYRAIVEKFETGKLTKEQFVIALRQLLPANKNLSDADIIAAWDSQIGEPDCEALQMVRGLKEKGFKTYALSTTNPLHVKVIEAKMRSCFAKDGPDPLPLVFDKRYYTPDLGLLKPDPAIFKKVLADGKMDPAKTLFLDDSPANVIGAQQAGIFALSVPAIGTGPRFTGWLPRLLSVEK